MEKEISKINIDEILEYIELHCSGFEEYEYRDAIEIGGIFRFKNYEYSERIFVDFYPFVLETGKTYHMEFMEKVENYLGHKEKMKQLRRCSNNN